MESFERVAEFYNKPNYGTDAYYPSNQLATFILRLTDTKTLTPYAIRVLKDYDVPIEIVAQPIEQPSWATR